MPEFLALWSRPLPPPLSEDEVSVVIRDCEVFVSSLRAELPLAPPMVMPIAGMAAAKVIAESAEEDIVSTIDCENWSHYQLLSNTCTQRVSVCAVPADNLRIVRMLS